MEKAPEIENIDERLAAEVTALSTKLVTAVARQSELEETAFQLHKVNAQLKSQLASSISYENQYKELFMNHEKLSKEFLAVKEKETVAVAQNAKLQAEVEDLTASLFNEANEMVSNASRETYNFKIKNRKLYEEIDEKNTIIEDLQEQLADLKQLFVRMDEKFKESQSGTPKLEQSQIIHTSDQNEEDSNTGHYAEDVAYQYLSATTYSPTIRAIRLDLNQFKTEFRSFIFHIIKPDFQFDLQNLKTTRFFKKIWTDELENSLTVPTITTSNFINRWQKGKSFWNLLVEGKAIIEPIKGINETFKLTYERESLCKDSPVATKHSCGFCNESRDDMLEHCRLYSLKLLNPDTTSSTSLTSNNENHEVVANYPLCNYCLVKLRNICDFFAKLRLIHSNVYKLNQNNQFDDVALVTTNFQFRRTSQQGDTESAHSSSQKVVKLPLVEEGKLIKLYIILTLIRAKIFWSKIGFWDNVNSVDEVNLDEIHHELFQSLGHSEHLENKNSSAESSNDPKFTTASDLEVVEEIKIAKKESADDLTEQVDDLAINYDSTSVIGITEEAHSLDRQESQSETHKVELKEEQEENILGTNNKEDSTAVSISNDHIDLADDLVASAKNATNDNDDAEEEFADTNESFSESSSPKKPEHETKLKRKNSKSKQFKKKINNGLDETLAMLEESIIE